MVRNPLKQLAETGLYSPELEHDSCGVGMVANIKGGKSHSIIEESLHVLKNLGHRGACGCDPDTGDGAGICVEIPKDFFLEKIKDTGHEHKGEEEICVGMIFLPRTEYSMQEKSKTIVEQVLLENYFY